MDKLTRYRSGDSITARLALVYPAAEAAARIVRASAFLVKAEYVPKAGSRPQIVVLEAGSDSGGTVVHPAGTAIEPQETVVHPAGTAIHPDWTAAVPPATTLNPGRPVELLPDGYVVHSAGTVEPTAHDVSPATIAFTGVIPSAIVGGTYESAYAILTRDDGNQATITNASGALTFGVTIDDDPTGHDRWRSIRASA